MLKKKLDELTMKDNFMFCAVMADVDNCRGFLEMCLGITVGRVEVSSEKSVVFRPEYRSVRLDVYVTRLQDSIRLIKSSREMEDKFMTLQEVILDERAEAKAEGRVEMILELLEDLGALPDEELAEKVMNEKRPEVLRRWLKLAARAASVGQFMEEIQ